LLAPGFTLRDENLGIFQPHVDTGMGNLLPAPVGVFEDRHIDPALLEIPETPGNRGGHQHELIVGLQAFSASTSCGSNPVSAPCSGARCRAEMRRANAHQLRSRSRHPPQGAQCP
jgi:hypothetical protein